MEMLHKPHYATALQVAKKFVASEDIRPILKVVYHRTDGSIVATDSHKLLIVRDVHGFKEEWLVNPKTFEFAQGPYPIIEKVLPEPKEPNFILNSNQIKAWMQAHKAMHEMEKEYNENNRVTLHMEKDKHTVTPQYNSVTMELPADKYVYPEFQSIGYNALYMYEALQALQKLGAQEVKIALYGSMQGFTLESENTLVLILPVRIY